MHKNKHFFLSVGVALGLVLSQFMAPMAAVADTGTSTVPLRLAGSDRYQTAAQIAEYGWRSTADNAVLAVGTDDHLVDALTAAPLAKAKSAPILLTQGDTLNPSTAAELQRLKVKTVYLVTGLGVVSQNVLDSLANMNIKVVNLGGSDRFSTALNIAGQLGAPSKVALVTAWTNADALSTAPVAAAEGMPILLTDKDSLSPEVANYLTTNKATIQKTYVIGGTEVISDAVASQMPNSVRLAGTDRYGTNLAVIQQFGTLLKPQYTFAASGDDAHLVDALTGAPLAALSNSLILLTGDSAFTDTAQQLTGLGLSTNIIGLGGSGSIPDNVLQTIENVLQTIENTIPAPSTGNNSTSGTPASGGTTPPSSGTTPSRGGGGGGNYTPPSSSTTTETLMVSNPATTGFTVTLNPALAGLTASNFTLLDSSSQPVTITGATTSDSGASYAISSALSAGQTYTVTATKTGCNFGTAQMSVTGVTSATGTWNLVQGVMTSDLTINVSGLSEATQYEVWGNGMAISEKINISGANNYLRAWPTAFENMSLLTIKLFNAAGDQVGQATLSGTTTNGSGSGTLN
ncbi:exported hypothetical protein [Candidatus Desulfosporosinus infrequens]|uniref:Cell wall-binding protein n=1 Tax=Candidatus Desulfosporosinus infrequens TaxID=2043169 RepID=A0A2U3LK75_9FIRM|nr:exported hypothetical protein [Candidatus Desulfosporosinus infrequens]